MTKTEFLDRFAENLENERTNLNVSQCEMAALMDISLSSYKRIVNRQTDKIDLYLSLKGYELTRKLACEMVGYSDLYLDVVKELKQCDDEELNHIMELIKILKRARGNNENNKTR